MNEHLRRALQALESGTADVRSLSSRSSTQVRDRLRRTVDEVLTHLEAEDRDAPSEPEDVVSRLSRQSQDIADELRRVEDLMKRRTGRE